MISGGELPNHPKQLKSLVMDLQERIRVLEHHNDVLRKLVFGPSSEKRQLSSPEPTGENQGNLFTQDLAEEAARVAEEKQVLATVEVVKEASPPKKKGRRKKFPDHLPVVRSRYELAEEDRVCGKGCGHSLKKIGEEVTRELERVEVSVVHEKVRETYACSKCGEYVVTAPGPDRVIDKGLLGPGFLAHVITERFGNHMPYNRLEKKYAREGLDLSRSVLCRSAHRSAEIMEPIYDQLKQDVVESDVVFTDDTPVTVAQSSNGSSRQGRVWVYLNREGRHFYEFTETRKRDGPQRVLGDYRGYIQADGYAGYDQLYLPGGATEVACWAHARRKFVDAESTDGELARQAVNRVGKLYAVEKTAKEHNLQGEELQALRQGKSLPVLEAFHPWLEWAETQVLPKSPMAKGIGYALRNWQALSRYVENPRLAIDNNAAERALRCFAVGRKNWLFFERESGGKASCILMSLLKTAEAASVDPWEYFRDVLLRIGRCSDVKKLTPHGWKEHFEPEVCSRRQRILNLLMGKAHAEAL